MIWLFAGGGKSELGEREGDIKGIVEFFRKHFPHFKFERITPVRDKRPPHRVKPNSAVDALGKTGAAFCKQIKAKLEDKIRDGSNRCDAILIVDDLDCFCKQQRKSLFENAVNEAGNGEFKDIRKIIGFAAPELEAWIIADWGNTIAKHIDFKNNHVAMQRWLVKNKVPFDSPETFSFFDAEKDSCHEKLSELLVESSRQQSKQIVYSKAKHTGLLIYTALKPQVVAEKCPMFRDFFLELQNLKMEN